MPCFRLRIIRQAVAVAVIFLASAAFAGRAAAGVSATAKTTLLRDEEYAEALVRGIREARERIIFSFYIFKTTRSKGNMPGRVANELLSARRRGVSVTVHLEKKGKRKDSLNDDNRRTALMLQRGGVDVRFDSPRVTTHTKAVVIDHRFVFLGSHNLTDSALRRNNELSVLLDSPEIAAEVEAYLDRL